MLNFQQATLETTHLAKKFNSCMNYLNEQSSSIVLNFHEQTVNWLVVIMLCLCVTDILKNLSNQFTQ
jgi:hypothetical protein